MEKFLDTLVIKAIPQAFQMNQIYLSKTISSQVVGINPYSHEQGLTLHLNLQIPSPVSSFTLT